MLMPAVSAGVIIDTAQVDHRRGAGFRWCPASPQGGRPAVMAACTASRFLDDAAAFGCYGTRRQYSAIDWRKGREATLRPITDRPGNALAQRQVCAATRRATGVTSDRTRSRAWVRRPPRHAGLFSAHHTWPLRQIRTPGDPVISAVRLRRWRGRHPGRAYELHQGDKNMPAAGDMIAPIFRVAGIAMVCQGSDLVELGTAAPGVEGYCLQVASAGGAGRGH